MATTAVTDTDHERDATLRVVAFDCLRRLDAGEAFLDESIERAHPDLMPELKGELSELRRIHAARQLVEQADGGSPKGMSSPLTAMLTVRCPECHTPASIAADSDLANMTCGSCGGQYSLVGRDDEITGATLFTHVGHFELLEQIGVGGFGAVWKARDKELDRLVAIKLPRRGQLGQDEAELFLREARAAAQLRHPNIVSVHEVGRDGDRVYLVSDLVEGVSLAEWLLGQRMSVREAAQLCQTIALALDHAHAAGIVHRDLKPGNVLLDAAGNPHLTDFGLARRQTQETTVTVDGQFLGTPAYMSPEQARGESHTADQRSDIYSLGVILYELLTGEVPFRGNPANLLHQIVHDDPRNPRAINRNVPRDLETIALKCLEKDASRRYATAKDLADDLAHFLHGEPILARPVGRVACAWRWCRRNPRTAGLAATVAALLLLVAAVTTYSAVQSRAAAREARWRQYLSDMHAAMKLWDEGAVGEVLNLLECHRPTTGAEDLREFEWLYLWKHVRSALDVPVIEHDSAINAAGISPDGKLLATGDWKGTLTVWDLTTRRVQWTRHVNDSFLSCAVFSPDGQTIATANSNGTLKLWPTDGTGEPRDLEGHHGQIGALAFSPDGKRLATGNEDRTVVVWNLATGEPEQVLSGHAEPVSLLVWKNSHRLLAAGYEGRIREWDVETGQPLSELARLPPRIGMGALSPDKSLLAVGCWDGAIRLLDAGDGTLRDTLVGHATGTMGLRLAFSADGSMLASGGRDNQVCLWDLRQSPARKVGILRGHSLAIWSVAFTPNGDSLVTASDDRTIRLWNVSGALRHKSELTGHTLYVLDVAFDHNGKWLASSAADKTVRIWDVATGEALHILEGGTNWMTSLASSPCEPLVAAACWDGRLTVWNAETGKRLWMHEGRADRVWQKVAFSPDGRVLLRGGEDGILTSYDSLTGETIGSFSHPLAGDFAFAPSGDQLAVCSKDGSITILDARSGERLRGFVGHRQAASSVMFSRDGRFLASGDGDGEVKIWDVNGGRQLHSLRHGAGVNRVAFSPDGRVLASAGKDSRIRLWDVAKGDQRAVLTGHKHWVACLAFSADGAILASGSDDRTVRLWRAGSGEEVDATPAN